MSTSYEPPPASGSASMDTAPDPVVAIIEGAGLTVGPGVAECVALAAAAHDERYDSGQADRPLVNRSTFLWALGREDDVVRAALAENGVDVDRFGRDVLHITNDPLPSTEPYGLDRELTRALETYLQPSTAQPTVTPWSLALAVLGDVVAFGGLLDTRLRGMRADPTAIVNSLLRQAPAGPPDEAPLPTMREVTPQRFGVQLRPGADPLPYVRRDADDELDRQLREHLPVVTIVAPAVSGAIRSAYEGLQRERADDHVLLLHEKLEGRVGSHQIRVEELDRWLASGAEVVWVRNFGDLVLLHPALEDWFRARGDEVAATIVLVVRPSDLEHAVALGLGSDIPIELSIGLSAQEQERVKGDYEGDIVAVSDLAAATVRQHGGARANFAADSAGALLIDKDTDDLDIRADVDMLAKLIASKDVHPPLSIGLFGPWGSGKSFLMRQVQLRIKELSDRSRELADEDATGYLGEIVPVEFNAWQYAHGTALWAALINRVFEEIREALGNDDRYRKVLQDIADKDVGVAQARAKVDDAQAVVDDSRPAAEDRVIGEVAKDHGMSEDSTKHITEGLDVDVAKQQVSDLKVEYDRLMTARSRLLTGWSKAAPGRKTVVVGLVVVGLVGLALYIWAPETYGQLVALATAALSLVGAATQVLKPVNKGLEQAAKLLQADDADKQKLQRAQDDLARANAELVTAKASGLAGLYGFVSERSSAAEYRQQLGMAPMIRDDLEHLAARSREAEGLPGIDRIVIYIDDLDRCPAQEVVRVLEAVNLLFGFELFVVVVAVDSRWLMRSLLSNFSDAFDENDASAPTPQNYLEKIIQIPFWVQPMKDEGFRKLVTSLAGEVDGSSDGRGAGDSGTGAGQDGGTGGGHPSGDGETVAPLAPDDAQFEGHAPPNAGPNGGGVLDPVPTDEHPLPVDGGGEGQGPDSGGGGSDVTAEDDLNPAALRLSKDERDFMTNFLPLVDTPRAVKRFLNTYQLLRVSVDDVGAFLDAEDYRPLLILLALMTGTTPLSPAMVEELRSMTEPNLAAVLAKVKVKTRATTTTPERHPYESWRPVAAACAKLPTETLTPALIKTWLPKVARYSFHAVDA